MKQPTLSALAGVLMTTIFSGAAFAGQSSDLAQAHFNAVANAEVESITAAYADDAVLQWIGGPLNGSYAGKTNIAALWQKFTGAQGKLAVEVTDLREDANPNGATVSANVTFKGQMPVPVYYVLTYRGDKLVNEVWQINPRLANY